MKTINILHIRDTFETGGPGKTIFETMEHIDSSRFTLHLATFIRYDQNDTPFVNEAKKRGHGVHVLRYGSRFSPKLLLDVHTLLKVLKIDLVHSHEVLSDVVVYIVSRFYKVPIITTLHGWINNNIKDLLKIRLDRYIARKYNKVIVVSEAMRSELMLNSGFDNKQLVLLHNCIVPEKYQRNSSAGYLGKIVQLKQGLPVIATVGRLSKEKGHKDFVEAVSIVVRSGYEANFLLIGDGPEHDALQQLIRRFGLESHVFMPGYVREIVKIYPDLDLMVLPSYTEGFSNVILEALLMNVPVIATKVGGNPEIIHHDRTGKLVDPHSPEMIAECIIDYLEDPEPLKRMALNGKNLVESEYTFAGRTRELERQYLSVCTI